MSKGKTARIIPDAPKVNNTSNPSKHKLRLEAIKDCGERDCRVLELYCGAGEMYKKVWRRSSKYLGVDIEKFNDERETIQGDAVKTISRLDLSKFNTFDIDAYGEPYTAMYELVQNLGIVNRDLYFCVTDGSEFTMRMGTLCRGLRLSLYGSDESAPKIVKRIHKQHDRLAKEAFKNYAKNTGTKLNKMLMAKGKTFAGVRYYYFQLTPTNK